VHDAYYTYFESAMISMYVYGVQISRSSARLIVSAVLFRNACMLAQKLQATDHA
jgi:hypothetical protein